MILFFLCFLFSYSNYIMASKKTLPKKTQTKVTEPKVKKPRKKYTRAPMIYDLQELQSLKETIDLYKAIPLSDGDIRRLVDNKANVVMYRNIRLYESIDELLLPHGACVILYETKDHFGHWCCITLRDRLSGKGHKVIEFFDPYGGEIDSQLKHIPEKFAQESGQNHPFLGDLMLKCDYKLSYNQFPFQELKANVADCGRWCALRIILKEATLEEFRDLFYNLYSDEWATLLTMDES